MSTNEPFDNSYASDFASNDQSTGGIELPPGQVKGMVGQTSVVGVLMIAQGIAEILFGGYQLVMALVFGAEMQDQIREQLKNNPAMQGNAAMDMDSAVSVAIGAVVVIGSVAALVGLFHIIAGIQVQRLKGRGLGFAALGLGLLTLFTCWCFPSALGIGIYGLVVLANKPVAKAMELVREGHSAAAVRSTFASLPS